MVVLSCALAIFVVIVLAVGFAECAPPTAMFVFGDSLVDVGNNNHLRSIAKANVKPNGIDFPNHVPTGRFCNGFLISDFLSQHWGLESTLAINDPNAKGQNLLRGANFASAGAGILDDTGFIFLQRVTLTEQVRLFREYVSNLTNLVGESVATQILSGGLYSFTIGANDFLANYYLPPTSVRRIQYTLPQYQSLLISRLSDHIKTVYGLGARNIAISSLGPIGCIPLLLSERFPVTTGKCVEFFQQVAISFNVLLKSLTEELQQELPGSTFLYSNGFDLVYDIIQNPTTFGLEIVNSACCGRGPKYRGFIPCGPIDAVCSNRSAYVFWDPYHPTERVNSIVAQKILFGPPSVISPINLSQLFP